MKQLIPVLLFIMLILVGCSNAVDPEIKTCLNDEDSEAEKECFMKLMCTKQDFDICKKLPDDTSARQGNKGFCLAFAASMTHDLRICRNQKNQYYANVCEIGYQRWGMSYNPSTNEEFNALREEYGCEFKISEPEEPPERPLTLLEEMKRDLDGSMSDEEIIAYCEEESINQANFFNCFMIGVRAIIELDVDRAESFCEYWKQDSNSVHTQRCMQEVNRSRVS